MNVYDMDDWGQGHQMNVDDRYYLHTLINIYYKIYIHYKLGKI